MKILGRKEREMPQSQHGLRQVRFKDDRYSPRERKTDQSQVPKTLRGILNVSPLLRVLSNRRRNSEEKASEGGEDEYYRKRLEQDIVVLNFLWTAQSFCPGGIVTGSVLCSKSLGRYLAGGAIPGTLSLACLQQQLHQNSLFLSPVSSLLSSYVDFYAALGIYIYIWMILDAMPRLPGERWEQNPPIKIKTALSPAVSVPGAATSNQQPRPRLRLPLSAGTRSGLPLCVLLLLQGILPSAALFPPGLRLSQWLYLAMALPALPQAEKGFINNVK
ncbi:hypothetical protein KQX54_019162 [Cotesia glomerata]|uniref:Uncharacterized protein n=1 Tax=Cotesia glomerata TaxID=32391 RepID=A0AAV7HFB2_COTGL|nr:hypothetical protein KQX54_019162 [Cotesia glomerata]